jgi:hypothetical protein
MFISDNFRHIVLILLITFATQHSLSTLAYEYILSFYFINMDSFTLFTFVFGLFWALFLTVISLFYKRIKTLRYLRWLPSTEPEPKHSI